MSTRIECGNGNVAVHNGIMEGIPCLVVTKNGTGIVGGDVNIPGNIAVVKPQDELLTVTFTNEESVNVWIKHLEAVRATIASA